MKIRKKVEVLPQTRLGMRVQLRLADQRSAGDVERLINRRTLRLWTGGPEGTNAAFAKEHYGKWYRQVAQK